MAHFPQRDRQVCEMTRHCESGLAPYFQPTTLSIPQPQHPQWQRALLRAQLLRLCTQVTRTRTMPHLNIAPDIHPTNPGKHPPTIPPRTHPTPPAKANPGPRHTTQTKRTPPRDNSNIHMDRGTATSRRPQPKLRVETLPSQAQRLPRLPPWQPIMLGSSTTPLSSHKRRASGPWRILSFLASRWELRMCRRQQGLLRLDTFRQRCPRICAGRRRRLPNPPHLRR
jgi:hypothetical protein